MLVLMACSAFFSASEAALFYLTRDDRKQLAQRGRAGRLAVELLASPERLLTSILFWNLVLNITYFAIASQIGLSLERQSHSREAGMVAIVSLLAIIFLSEMLPKNLAVLWPRQIARLVSLPLATATRLLDPMIPFLQAAHRVSLRTLLPGFKREPSLDLSDLERAITLSTPGQTQAKQEELVLQQIVSLSEVTAEELMRPRRELSIFHSPVSLDDLRKSPPANDYLLVAEPGGGEISLVLAIAHLPATAKTDLQNYCEPVPYVPWSASGADTLDLLRVTRSGIVAVVNEHGETMGIVTFDDLLHLLFSSPTGRHSKRNPAYLHPVDDGTWELSGAVTLRRLAKHLHLTLPSSKSVTVAGMLQENLQRLPSAGDEVLWGGCRFVVVDSPQPGVVTTTVDVLPDSPNQPAHRGASPTGGDT